MRIRLQALLNAAAYISKHHGQEALDAIVARCDTAVVEHIKNGSPLTWHEAEEFIAFLTHAEALLGGGHGKLSEAIGGAGADANLGGMLMKLANYLATPSFLFRRVAGLWTHFNSEGKMTTMAFDAEHARFEVVGITKPNYFFCCTITGWFKSGLAHMGVASAKATHVSCRAKGDAQCIFEARW